MVLNPEESKRQPIDWDVFKTRYFTPEKGRAYELVLANWGMKDVSFDDGKTVKKMIECDVLKIDGEEFPVTQKVFRTASPRFAVAFKPIAEAAEARGHLAVEVYLERTMENHYIVRDLGKMRGKY